MPQTGESMVTEDLFQENSETVRDVAYLTEAPARMVV